ncbi:hypothetical protein [Luteimonas sp. MC1825]|jgi:tetratricopeptide (TPR) repeat protein|uniref:hypothetical protein n=1 Tax=Luteimonas sp. MC1825 TaxID=2761107 RepID=UPI001613A2DE|nr:hypothetical protein [Luteimonas sp. MC1825]MBB6600642.1 hypothetical protein [Luteimonas sp. MC1825]QOC88240.1 hypothetical protein IDM46_00195 [Luteimonas sp. MC1825]
MTDDRWFRNKSWDADIASLFEEKLRRARRKSQYLRIQASSLTQANPQVALDLLDRYFALGEDFDHAQAHVDRAAAYLTLGRVEDAFMSYEAALNREAEFPNLRTGAYLELPYQIALRGAAHRYDQAMALLSRAAENLMFAVDHFVFHATKAIILSAQGNLADARAEARPALEAASRDHSGFRYHPGVGLVSDKHSQALALLRPLCDA